MNAKIYILILTLISFSLLQAMDLNLAQMDQTSDQTQGVKRKKPSDGFDEDDNDDRKTRAKIEQLSQQDKAELNKKLLGATEIGDIELVKKLLQDGADIECIDNEEKTPLFLAIGNKHLEICKLLIALKANINKMDSRGCTSLRYLLRSTDTKDPSQFAYLLLKHNAELFIENPLSYKRDYSWYEKAECLAEFFNDTANKRNLGWLWENIIENKHQWLKEMLNLNVFEKSLNVQDKFGMTPLMWAACRGHSEIVKLLLNKKVDATLKNFEDLTALTLASNHSDTFKILYEYLSNETVDDYDEKLKATIEHLSSEGKVQLNKRLLAAAGNGDVGAVKSLLEENADIESRNIDGETPLFIAIDKRQLQTAKLLIESKANVNTMDISGLTSLYHLTVTKQEEDSSQFIYLLLKNNSELFIEEPTGPYVNWNPMFGWYNVNFQFTRKTAWLTKSFEGNSNKGHLAYLLEHIIENKHHWLKEMADFYSEILNTQDKFGMTLLMWAACRGHTEIVKLLLNQKVDATLQNFENENALTLASNQPEVFKILYKYFEPQRNNIINALVNSDAIILDNSSKNLIAEYILGGKNG